MKTLRDFLSESDNADMKHRQATDDEVRDDIERSIRIGSKVKVRHFTRELYAPRSKNGVKHVNHTSVKPFIKDGKAYAKIRGETHELTASHATLPSGRGIVWDHRIKSEHLK